MGIAVTPRSPSKRKLIRSGPIYVGALLLVFLSAATRSEDFSILLIAAPALDQSIFQRSVILVSTHDDGTAMGVILNRPLPVDSSRLYPGDDLMKDAGLVHFGGPVHISTLLFLFQASAEPENALHLFDDIYLSNDRQILAEQLRRPRSESRLEFYAGYAGWAQGQLQAEILEGSWTTVRASSRLVFDTDRTSIWEVLRVKRPDDWI